MLIKCCIIENDISYATLLKKQLLVWSHTSNCNLDITISASHSIFFEKKPDQFDVIFLDIMLNSEKNGLDIAKWIRKNNYKVDIIFLTSFSEYVFEGYPLQALDYLLKPASQEKINHCMNLIFSRFNDANFICQQRGVFYQIPYKNILYFSSNNHHVNIFCKETTYCISQTLRNTVKNLPAQFLPIHRTLIVNMNHVTSIIGKELLLDTNERLPISLSYLKAVQLWFINQCS